ERDVARERGAGVEVAGEQAGVGDGRIDSAVAVTGRAWTGARRAWADAQRTAVVAPGEAASAGADGVDVDHRQRQRTTRDLAAAGHRDPSVEHQRYVAGR